MGQFLNNSVDSSLEDENGTSLYLQQIPQYPAALGAEVSAYSCFIKSDGSDMWVCGLE